jgi:signal transduction histidine kinase
MQLMPRHLHTRLFLAVTLAMVAGTLGLSFWTATSQYDQLYAARLQQVSLLTSTLAEGSAHAYVIEDYASLEHYLRHSVVLPGLRRVIATDTQGTVLSALERMPGADAVRLASVTSRVNVPATAEQRLEHSGDTLLAWQPIMAGGLLGWLQVTYQLDDIVELQSRVWRYGIVLGLAELIGGLGLFMLLLRRPIRSINSLSAFARELPHQKGRTIPVDQSVLELAELGEALNHASTELARIEYELLELNQTLQNRVEEEVAKSREKDVLLLQQARYQTLGELLVNISHHWRQPLNAIGASIQQQAWQIANGELLPEQAVPKAEEVMVILQQLSHSLEGFRQLCRPAASSVTFSPSAAVAIAVAAVSEGYHLQGVEIRQQLMAERPIYGPQQELVQVLLNLLSNARDALFANQVADGLIVVQVSLPEPDRVVITVSDNGGGIPERVQATLFDPYVTTKFRSQGVGLGLFVVRQLVEQRFCGTVEACNSEDGARLTLTIPAAPGGSTP